MLVRMTRTERMLRALWLLQLRGEPKMGIVSVLTLDNLRVKTRKRKLFGISEGLMLRDFVICFSSSKVVSLSLTKSTLTLLEEVPLSSARFGSNPSLIC